MECEKRLYTRYKIDIIIRYKESGIKKTVIGKLLNFYKKAKSINISGGGALLYCRKQINSGTELHVSFSLPETEIEVKGIAEVMWISKEKSGYFIGIKFVQLNIEGDEVLEPTLKQTDKEFIEKVKYKILQKLFEQEYTNLLNRCKKS